MENVCQYEIDFYILQSLRNNSLASDTEIFKNVREEVPEVEDENLRLGRKRVNGIIKRYSAVVDPLVKGLIPFYAFINVRENFKAVTDSINRNISKVAGSNLIAVYDLIGKPDFMIIGLTEGAKGRLAEEFTHQILTEMGGETIHNYLTTQVEIPRSIKKFWHTQFYKEDFEDRLSELKSLKYDESLLQKLQEDCRKVERSKVVDLEKDGIVKGYSVVIKPDAYPSREWNFIKAFIQVDALYARFDDLYSLIEEKYSKEIRATVQIPYSKYGMLVECEVANIARLRDIMGTIRNEDYVRTTRTAIARNVVLEDLWVI
jgi:DNA-binding Lrp family transcriptional regulator